MFFLPSEGLGNNLPLKKIVNFSCVNYQAGFEQTMLQSEGDNIFLSLSL